MDETLVAYYDTKNERILKKSSSTISGSSSEINQVVLTGNEAGTEYVYFENLLSHDMYSCKLTVEDDADTSVGESNFSLASSSDYVLDDDNLLTGVKLNQNTVSAVTAQFTNANLVCVDASGNQLSDSDKLGTGAKICLVTGDAVKAECTVVIAGDIIGDGKITGKDVNIMAQSCVAKTTLSDAQKAAADLDGDGKVTGKDVNILAQVCVGKKTISSQE
jgi:hypothetical protein